MLACYAVVSHKTKKLHCHIVLFIECRENLVRHVTDHRTLMQNRFTDISHKFGYVVLWNKIYSSA